MLGQNLKVIMTMRNKTGTELARELNISPLTISLITTGKTKNPRMETVRSLAKALDVKVDDLYRTDLVKL